MQRVSNSHGIRLPLAVSIYIMTSVQRTMSDSVFIRSASQKRSLMAAT